MRSVVEEIVRKSTRLALGRVVREREMMGVQKTGRKEFLFSFNAILISIKLSSCSNNVSTRSQVSSYMVTSCEAGKVEGAGKLNSAAASGGKCGVTVPPLPQVIDVD